MKKLTAILLIVAMMLTLGACSKKSDDATGPIKIGVVGARTGESSLWGDVMYHTVQLLADDVNENGGLLGGRKIEILSYDNRDDVVETTNVARKAILNDGVCAFIGCEASATTIALVDVATEYKVPVISTIATNTKVTMTDDGKVRPYAFRACLNDPQSGTILGQYTVEKLGYKNVAIIYEIGSDFSLGVSGQYAAAVEAAGGTAIPKVEFVDAGLTYAEAKESSIEGLSLKVKRGETIGIIGGTGSGKSTLVNLIPRFYDCTQGSIKIDGVDVKEYPKEQLIEKIGVVPQKAVLFSGTIADNIRWGKEDATNEEIEEALSIAQAEDFVQQKEGGIEFVLNQGGKNLSGGQKQRLTIARALVKKPEILILDDSSSALDYATDAALRKAIKEKTDHTTVFLVSQRASSIMYADKIVVLDDGKIAGIGDHDTLMKNCPVYQEIYASQNKEVKADV